MVWVGNDGFYLIGYFLGGGIVVLFVKDFFYMVWFVVFIVGGGLIWFEYVSWRSRLLYLMGIFLEWVFEFLVWRCFMLK